MRVIFTNHSWIEYTSWLIEDKRNLKKINKLIKEIKSDPFKVTGKPEPLKFDLAGFWSRRISQEHRLVYKVRGEDILIYSCKFHYDK